MANLPPLNNISQLDPITNLPVNLAKKIELPPLSGNQIITRPLESKYDLSTFPEQDLEQVREDRQGAGETILYGATRLALTTGTKALSGISSLGELIANTPKAIIDTSLEPYNNTPVSNAVNEIEENIKASFPIYNTKQDQDKNFLMRAFTDLDYWMDDMADGAAFIASAYLTGMGANKLVSPLLKARYGAKLAEISKLGAAELEELPAEIKAANALMKSNLAEKYNTYQQLITTGVSRSIESLAEGAQTRKQVYDKLLEQGYDPDQASKLSAQAAMTVFGLNMLLAPLDFDQYSGWFKTYSKSRDQLLKLGKSGALEVAIPSFGKAFAKHVGRNAFSEGILEEGLQAAMQNYAEKRYTGQYDDEYVDPISGVLSEYLKGFTTKEGWDAMGAGMLLGGLFGGVTEAFGEAGPQARKSREYLKQQIASNDYLKSSMQSFVTQDKDGKPVINKAAVIAKIADMAQQGQLSMEMVKSLSQDYEEAYKTIDNLRFANWAYSHFESGMAEKLYADIDGLSKLNDAQLREQGLISDDMKNSDGKTVTAKEITERYRQKAVKLEELYNRINSRFEIPNQKVGRQLFEEAVLQDETVVSLNKINQKIATFQADLANKAQAMGTPEFQEFQPGDKALQDLDNKELELLFNRRQDLVNTLKDSYKRVDELTLPENIKAERRKAEEALAQKESEDEILKEESEAAKAEQNITDPGLSTLFKNHRDKFFKIKLKNGKEAVVSFERKADGSYNPNSLVDFNSKTKHSTVDYLSQLYMTKPLTQDDYYNELVVEERVKAINNLMTTEKAKHDAFNKEISKIEARVLDILIELEEFQKYKKGKDSKYRRIGVKGSKTYTEATLHKAVEDLEAARDLYLEEIARLNQAKITLDENLAFLSDYKAYLLDPKIPNAEKVRTLNSFEEDAIMSVVPDLENSIKEHKAALKTIEATIGVYSKTIDSLNKTIADLKAKLAALSLTRMYHFSRTTGFNFKTYLTQAIQTAEATGELSPGTVEIVDELDNTLNRLAELARINNPEDANEVNLLKAKISALLRDTNSSLIPPIFIKYLSEVIDNREYQALLDQEQNALNSELEASEKEVDRLTAKVKALGEQLVSTETELKKLIKAQGYNTYYEVLEKVFDDFENKIFTKFFTPAKVTKPKAKKKTKPFPELKSADNLDQEDVKKVFADPIRTLYTVFNGTAGSNVVGNTQIITDDPNQRRWFEVTDKLDMREGPYFLRAITKDNNPFPDSIKFDDDYENLIYLVLYDKDQPYLVDDKPVYTTMRDPKLEDLGKYINKKFDGKPYTPAEIEAEVERYQQLRAAILNQHNDKKDYYFKVTNASSGVMLRQEPSPALNTLVKSEDELASIQVIVVTNTEVPFNGSVYTFRENQLGMAMVAHKQRAVPLILLNMEELGAIDALMDYIKTVVQEPFGTTKSKAAIREIKKLIFWGPHESDSPFKIFYDKKQGLFFNGKYHNNWEAVNKEELAEFLGTKTLNIDSALLKSDAVFFDPVLKDSNNKPIVWPSYRHYLFSSKGRKVDQIPAKVRLTNLDEQQYLNAHLHFNSNKVFSKPEELLNEPVAVVKVKEQPKSKTKTKKVKSVKGFDMAAEMREEARSKPAIKPGKLTLPPRNKKVESTPSSNDAKQRFNLNTAPTSKDTSKFPLGNKKPNQEQEESEQENAQEDIPPLTLPGAVPFDDIDLSKLEDEAKNDDPEDDLARTFTSEIPASKETLDAEEAWFKSVVPKEFADAYSRVEGIIKGRAVGLVTRHGETLISNLAAPGTTYHEAWHIVSQFLLTPEELSDLYNSYRARTGKNLSSRQTEEEIAEGFREYMLTGKSPIPEHESIFKRLLDIIRDFFLELFGKNPKTIEKLYAKIKEGKFATKNVVSTLSTDWMRVPGLSAEYTAEVNSVITTYLFNELFKGEFSLSALNNLDSLDLKDLYQLVKERLIRSASKNYIKNGVPIDAKSVYGRDLTAAEFNALPVDQKNKSAAFSYVRNTLMVTSDSIWPQVVQSNKEYLRQFGINIQTRETPEESLNELTDTPNGRNLPDYVESIKFSTKDGLPDAVKLAVFTIPSQERSYLFGLSKLGNFEYNFNYLHDRLAGSVSVEQVMSKLKAMTRSNSENIQYLSKKLLERLDPGDSAYHNDMSEDRVLFMTQFAQQFCKTKHTYKLTMITQDGEIYQLDSDGQALKDKMISLWRANAVRNIKSSVYDLKNGKYKFNKGTFDATLKAMDGGRGYNKNNFIHTLQVLNLLGIKLALYDEYKKSDSKLRYTSEEQNTIRDTLNNIITWYAKNPDLDDMFKSDALGSALTNLSMVELNYTNDAIELSHRNPEGETVYSLTLNNYLSIVLNKIASGGLDAVPHLKDDIYSANSVWKETLSKNPKAAKLQIIEGLKYDIPGSDGEITSKLTTGDYIVTYITSVMSDVYPFMRAGDKKLEYGIKIAMPNIASNYIDVIRGYAKDELNRIVEARSSNSDVAVYNKYNDKLVLFYNPIFKSLHNLIKGELDQASIDRVVNSSQFENEVETYLDSIVNETLDVLQDYRIISKESKGYANYGLPGLNSIVRNRKGKIIPESAVAGYIKEFIIKDYVSKVEQTKLFLGDLAFYNHAKNDGPKRVGGMVGTKKLAFVDPSLNAWLSKEPRIDGKDPDGTFNAVVLTDPTLNAVNFIKNAAKALNKKESDPLFKAYTKIDIADAQGYITLPEYREFLIRVGDWTPEHAAAYKDVLAGKPLNSKTFQLFQPLKPQYFGPQLNEDNFTPLFLKFSVIPLLPSVIKNDTKLAKLNQDMLDNKIGIVTFGSAAKVGAKINSLTSDPSTWKVSNLDYSYMGIQLDIAPEVKTKVTFGTQFRKLILSNLMPNGVGKSIRVQKDEGVLTTINSSELVNDWNNTVSALTKINMTELFNKLNVAQALDNNFRIKNFTKFKDMLMRESLERGMPENARIALDLAITEDQFSLDVMSNKVKIEQILYSIINNNLIKQKTFGDMKVQASGYGTAKTEAKEDSSLKFYTNENGIVTAMEVMLPHWFKEVMYKTDPGKVDPKLLTLIGFRIPTQGFNSMEVMKIKGFLPPEAGNVIHVPAELPAKAGSDFDIDKLTLFFPKYEVVTDEGNLINWLNNKLKKANQSILDATNLDELEDYLDSLDEVADEDLTPKDLLVKQLYNEFQDKQINKRFTYPAQDLNTKAGLQNKLIDLARQILTSPDFYENLITPNTTDTLKQAANEVRDVRDLARGEGRMLEFPTNLKTAMDYWAGKDGVGIAALNNTHHVLSQIADLKILPGAFINVNIGKDKKVAVKINLPHNVKNGAISFSSEYDVENDNRISDMISEFLNAYVDISKDPFIFDLNAGTDTANIWFTLVRAGVPVKTIAWFMAQPVIKDLLHELAINKSLFIDATGARLSRSKVLELILERHNITQDMFDNAFNDQTKLSVRSLQDAIKNPNPMMSARILADYLVYEAIANDLSDLQKSTTYDTAGVGKSKWQSRAAIEATQDVLKKTVFNNADKILQDSTIAPFHEVARVSRHIFDEGYIIDHPKFQDLRERMMEISKTERSSANRGKMLNYMENEFILYLLSTVKHKDTIIGNYFKRLFTGEDSLPKRMLTLKDKYPNNVFVNAIIPIISNDRSSTDNIRILDNLFNSYQSDLLTEGLTELFRKEPSMATEILYLMMLQGGINKSFTSLYSLIPNDIFIPNVSSLIFDIVKNSSNEINTEDFLAQFYANNHYKSEFVPRVRERRNNVEIKLGNDPKIIISNVNSRDKAGRKYTDFDYLTVQINNPNLSLLEIEDLKSKKAPKSEYMVNLLFKKSNITDQYAVYDIVQPRGNGPWAREYYPSAAESSVVTKNNALLKKERPISSPVKTVLNKQSEISSSAQELWDKHSKALITKFGIGIKDRWFIEDNDWRAYKIKCL